MYVYIYIYKDLEALARAPDRQLRPVAAARLEARVEEEARAPELYNNNKNKKKKKKFRSAEGPRRFGLRRSRRSS